MRDFLIDPRFGQNLRRFFPSFCTILEPNAARDELNDLNDGTPSVFAGHDSIRCLLVFPTLRGSRFLQEQRTAGSTYNSLLPQVNLDGYYPMILLTHTAQIDGVNYNIRSVTPNSTKTLTKLEVESIT